MIAGEGSPQGLNSNYKYPWKNQEHHMKSGLNSQRRQQEGLYHGHPLSRSGLLCVFSYGPPERRYNYIQGSGTNTGILARYVIFHMVQEASVSMEPYIQNITMSNQTISNVQSSEITFVFI